jgi:hypothetical protein
VPIEFLKAKGDSAMASPSNQAARVSERRPVEAPAAPRPVSPQPETKPSKFVIKVMGTIPQ